MLLAFCAAQVLAQVPVTPGGLGFVEAGLTATLTLAGVGPGKAVLATLAYRLFAYWLQLPAGLVGFLIHKRRYSGAEAASSTDRITYVGHATALIELDGVRVLTDPVFRPRLLTVIVRQHEPDPGIAERIDAVLISHLHHDHLDFASLRRIGLEVPIVAPAGAGPRDPPAGVRAGDRTRDRPGHERGRARGPRRRPPSTTGAGTRSDRRSTPPGTCWAPAPGWSISPVTPTCSTA